MSGSDTHETITLKFGDIRETLWWEEVDKSYPLSEDEDMSNYDNTTHESSNSDLYSDSEVLERFGHHQGEEVSQDDVSQQVPENGDKGTNQRGARPKDNDLEKKRKRDESKNKKNNKRKPKTNGQTGQPAKDGVLSRLPQDPQKEAQVQACEDRKQLRDQRLTNTPNQGTDKGSTEKLTDAGLRLITQLQSRQKRKSRKRLPPP